MSNEIDFDELLRKYKSDPFDYVDVFAVHTGQVSFKVVEGEEVEAPSGEWLQVPGTRLYEINRERNPKIVAAQTNGTVAQINTDFDGRFVEAGEKLMTIKHPLKKKEIIENILKEVLSLSRPRDGQIFLCHGYPVPHRKKRCPSGDHRAGRRDSDHVAYEEGYPCLLPWGARGYSFDLF